MATISPVTRRRLDIQGFDGVDDQTLAESGPWLRLAFALCAALAATGTILGSPALLLTLVPIAVLGAVFPVHPFDLLYNHGLRHLTRTRPLPRRGAPTRFACVIGAAWLLMTAWAFSAGHTTVGYVLGSVLVCLGLLVSTTDICIPSLLYRALFGFPPTSASGRA